MVRLWGFVGSRFLVHTRVTRLTASNMKQFSALSLFAYSGLLHDHLPSFSREIDVLAEVRKPHTSVCQHPSGGRVIQGCTAR